MDAMYKSIYETLPLNQKLVRVIKENSFKKFKEIIEKSELTNAIIDNQSEETTLHLCVRQKNNEMIKLLLQRGANPLQKNLFNASALEISLKMADTECLITLLEFCPVNLIDYWNKYKDNNEEVLKILVIGTHLNNDHPCVGYFKAQAFPSTKILNLICFVNHLLPPSLSEFLKKNPEISPEFQTWYTHYSCQVPTLKHCSRIGIRNAMKYNTYYCYKQLILPSELQKYLIDFSDCFE